MRIISRRNGFTLVELLIVIVVIGVLAAMMIMSSDESVSTAKAAKIIANLHTLKRATMTWYMDNREKVQLDGRVKIGNTIKPVQEWGDKIQLSKYISSMNDSGIKFYPSYQDPNTNNQNTDLMEGYYGLCDGGTFKEKVTKGETTTIVTTEFHRNAWYVGYRFKASEKKVREKIRGRMESSGVFLGTADAHKDTYNDDSAAVWMRVL